MQVLNILPDADSYVYTPAPVTHRVQHDGSSGRFGVLLPNPTARVQAKWSLTQNELGEFNLFYRRHAKNQVPFRVDLITTRGELQTCIAFFDTDTFSMRSTAGKAFSISCTLQVSKA